MNKVTFWNAYFLHILPWYSCSLIIQVLLVLTILCKFHFGYPITFMDSFYLTTLFNVLVKVLLRKSHQLLVIELFLACVNTHNLRQLTKEKQRKTYILKMFAILTQFCKFIWRIRDLSNLKSFIDHKTFSGTVLYNNDHVFNYLFYKLLFSEFGKNFKTFSSFEMAYKMQ